MLLRIPRTSFWAHLTGGCVKKPFLRAFRYHSVLVGAPARRAPPCSLLLSTAAAEQDAAVPFMLGYLVGSCGLSTKEAARASKPLAHVKSPQNPDSVLAFLRSKGFDNEQIRKIVSSRPQLLCADVEKTLEPKFRALEAFGFRGPQLFDVIKQNNRFLCCSQDRVILPNISILMQDCGISEARILKILQRSSWVVSRKTSSLLELIERVEELGFGKKSGMFEHALCVLAKYTRSTVASKIERYVRLGWTEQEILAAVRSAPVLLTLSDKKLKLSMDFLMGEVGFRPADIASYPVMLMFSLEKRVMPRYRVLQFLRSKGLPEGNSDFSVVLRPTERRFFKRFLVPYIEEFPELEEAYRHAAPESCPAIVV